MENNVSRQNQLTEAQLGIISTTGKISGEVKDILICNDKHQMLEHIDLINKNLKGLMLEIYKICEALNLDFNEIVGGVDGNKL